MPRKLMSMIKSYRHQLEVDKIKYNFIEHQYLTDVIYILSYRHTFKQIDLSEYS